MRLVFLTNVPFSTAMSLHSWFMKTTQPTAVQVSTWTSKGEEVMIKFA